MCLAVPARIISVKGDEAVAETGGVRRKIIVALIGPTRPGDCVLIHAGFAIRKWTEADLREYNAIVGASVADAAPARRKRGAGAGSGKKA